MPVLLRPVDQIGVDGVGLIVRAENEEAPANGCKGIRHLAQCFRVNCARESNGEGALALIQPRRDILESWSVRSARGIQHVALGTEPLHWSGVDRHVLLFEMRDGVLNRTIPFKAERLIFSHTNSLSTHPHSDHRRRSVMMDTELFIHTMRTVDAPGRENRETDREVLR